MKCKGLKTFNNVSVSRYTIFNVNKIERIYFDEVK